MIIVCACRQHATFGDCCRHRAIGMIQTGSPQRDVALWFAVQNTISSLWRRFQTTEGGNDRPRSGRPRVTSQRQDQYIRVTHLRNRIQTASVTARIIPGLRRIHPRTGCNHLREHHIRPRRPSVRTLLLPRHRAERLWWSRAHLRWRLREWEAVLRSISILSGSFRWSDYMVYRRVGERCQDACIRPRRAFGGGSVMVSGGISADGRTPLVIINGNLNAHYYLGEVVRLHVLPFVRGQRRNMTFQQDNARPHVVRLIMNFLRHENVLVMALPSMSPDSSSIEHAWDEMDRRLRQRSNQPVTLQGLGEALQEVWQESPQAFHANLVASMRRRCQDVAMREVVTHITDIVNCCLTPTVLCRHRKWHH